MNIEPVFNLIEVKFQRHYPGYIYRREIVDDSEYGGDGHLEMINCYSEHTGKYMGDAKLARYLCKKRGIMRVQGRTPKSNVCSIGFNEQEQKWYGWSHRAIAGFGIGDRIFDATYGDDDTPITQHGAFTIASLADAKQAAINFAEYVS